MVRTNVVIANPFIEKGKGAQIASSRIEIRLDGATLGVMGRSHLFSPETNCVAGPHHVSGISEVSDSPPALSLFPHARAFV